MSKIIFLNGDSSAGKFSVAREITSMNSIVSKVDKNEIQQGLKPLLSASENCPQNGFKNREYNWGE